MKETMKSVGVSLLQQWKWVALSFFLSGLIFAVLFDASPRTISVFLLASILSGITLGGWIQVAEWVSKDIPEKFGWWASSAIGTVFCTVVGGCVYFINPADAPPTLNEAMLFDAILREGSFMEARAVEAVFIAAGLFLFLATLILGIKKIIQD